jgi:hypothetical protein
LYGDWREVLHGGWILFNLNFRTWIAVVENRSFNPLEGLRQLAMAMGC